MVTQLLVKTTDQPQDLAISFDIAQQSQYLELRGVSRQTLWRHRQLAIAHIPDYELISDRFWEYRYGEPFAVSCLLAASRGKREPDIIDKPPFCRSQMEVLSAVQRMYRTGSTTFSITQKLKADPTYWRKF